MYVLCRADDEAFSPEHENLHQRCWEEATPKILRPLLKKNMIISRMRDYKSKRVVIQFFLTLDSVGMCTRLIRDWKFSILASVSYSMTKWIFHAVRLYKPSAKSGAFIQHLLLDRFLRSPMLREAGNEISTAMGNLARSWNSCMVFQIALA